MFHLHLPQALPDDVCERLLTHARSANFERATVHAYGKTEAKTSVRNNERLEWDNPLLAREMEGHLMVAAGQYFPYTLDTNPGASFARASARFRLYRYLPEQYFKPHKDGHFREGQEESLVTVLVYLNTTDGGETLLMRGGPSHREEDIVVFPIRGDVLMFHHDTWHEGRPVTRGEKYVLRTDFFYRSPGR